MELGMVLTGIGASALTRLAGKLGISKRLISVLLAIVGGAIYYVATNYYQATWESGVQFAVGVYGASQLVYNLLKVMNKEGQ